MKLVDTHQHLWDLEQFPYSWCNGIPALNRSFRLDDYLAAAQNTGIEKRCLWNVTWTNLICWRKQNTFNHSRRRIQLSPAWWPLRDRNTRAFRASLTNY